MNGSRITGSHQRSSGARLSASGSSAAGTSSAGHMAAAWTTPHPRVRPGERSRAAAGGCRQIRQEPLVPEVATTAAIWSSTGSPPGSSARPSRSSRWVGAAPPASAAAPRRARPGPAAAPPPPPPRRAPPPARRRRAAARPPAAATRRPGMVGERAWCCWSQTTAPPTGPGTGRLSTRWPRLRRGHAHTVTCAGAAVRPGGVRNREGRGP